MQDRIIATSSSLGPRPRMRGKEDVIVAVSLAEVVQYNRDVVEIAPDLRGLASSRGLSVLGSASRSILFMIVLAFRPPCDEMA